MLHLTIRPELFRERLLSWWFGHRRSFPWRETHDPYRILLSEVMLHRTRADQVLKVYPEFLRRFPSPGDLASASQRDVEEILRPLGLRWRARLVSLMARKLVKEHGGQIPSDPRKLKALPGVSEYIASAVMCFAFGVPEPLLDTNTVRIVGRVFGIPTRDASRRSKIFREAYRFLLDEERPREFNYAMLDLGALLCRARRPLCKVCPVRELCEYGKSR